MSIAAGLSVRAASGQIGQSSAESDAVSGSGWAAESSTFSLRAWIATPLVSNDMTDQSLSYILRYKSAPNSLRMSNLRCELEAVRISSQDTYSNAVL